MDGIIHQVNLEKMKYEKVEGYELAFRYEMLLNELEVWGVSNTHTHTHTHTHNSAPRRVLRNAIIVITLWNLPSLL